MGENYKFLYEQMKKTVTMYQDEIVPEIRKLLDKAKRTNKILIECIDEIEYQNRKNSENWIDGVIQEYRNKLEEE